MSVESKFSSPPHNESPAYPEHEVVQQAELAWLAGLCESGGSLYFAIQQRSDRDYMNAYPYITIQSAKTEVKDYLYNRYQGADSPAEPGTWRLGGFRAAELIVAMKPWLSTRNEFVVAVENWLNTEDAAERVTIAEDNKNQDRFKTPTIEDYQKLLADPAFLAGVLDNRATIYAGNTRGWEHPRVSITSMHIDLLVALYNLFGGSITVKQAAGEEKTINGKTFQTKRDSYSWNVSAAKARAVIALALPYLRIKPYEGWDVKLSETKKIAVEEQIQLLQEYVENEISEFEAGERFTLSTNEELAGVFELSHTTAKRRLSSLPSELRLTRERIIRSTHHSILNPMQIHDMVSKISNEVAEYEAGVRQSFTGNKELAEQLGVGVHILNRNVMPQVPQDQARLRQQVINSQTTAAENKRRAEL